MDDRGLLPHVREIVKERLRLAVDKADGREEARRAQAALQADLQAATSTIAQLTAEKAQLLRDMQKLRDQLDALEKKRQQDLAALREQLKDALAGLQGKAADSSGIADELAAVRQKLAMEEERGRALAQEAEGLRAAL